MAAPSMMSGMTGATSGMSFMPTNLPKVVLSPDDIQYSISAYEVLLTTAKAYRNALATLAQMANAFGAALESCARLKGVEDASEGLLSAAGLHFLIANHQSVLSDTVYRSYEIPLRENLESFVLDAGQRREEYLRELARRKKMLAEREKKHIALAHRNKRSLGEFRAALSDLTMLADDIDKLKSDYFFTSLGSHNDTWHRVSSRSGIVCKAELQLYTAIGQKQENMLPALHGVSDPWQHEVRSGDDLFSIVPPQEILARPQSPSHESGLFASLLGTLHEARIDQVATTTATAGASRQVSVGRHDLFSTSPKSTGAGVSALPVVTRFHAEQEHTPTRTHQAYATKRATNALKRLSGERVPVPNIALQTPTRLSQGSESVERPLDETAEADLSSPYQDAEEPVAAVANSTTVSPAKPSSAGTGMSVSIRQSSRPSTPVKSGSAGSHGYGNSIRHSQSSSARKLDFERELGSSATKSTRTRASIIGGASPAKSIVSKLEAEVETVMIAEGNAWAQSPESLDKHSDALR